MRTDRLLAAQSWSTRCGGVDDVTDSAWIASSGQVVNVPLDFGAVLIRACEVVGRDLTQGEWDLYVPGDEPLQSACE